MWHSSETSVDWFENSTILCKSVGEVSVMLGMSGGRFDVSYLLLLKTSRVLIDNYVKCLTSGDEGVSGDEGKDMKCICFGDKAIIEDTKKRICELLNKKQNEVLRCVRCELYGQFDLIHRFEKHIKLL